jgi:glycerol 2-dehydrogenase (NADP+)
MHWPAPMLDNHEGPDRGYTWQQAWEDMVQVFRENPEKVRAIGTSNRRFYSFSVDPSIGVSNFSAPFLRDLFALETGVIPAVNQIELHPYCQKAQQEIVDECLKHHIILTAYSPLGSGHADMLKEPLIEEIATKYGVTPANVLISLQANKPHHTGQSHSLTPL